MPDISKINVGGIEYNIKDAEVTGLKNKFITSPYNEGNTYSIVLPTTPTLGTTYLLLIKNWTSNTTFVYDLAALTFTSSTVAYVDFIQKNSTADISSVSVSGTNVIITFSATKYISVFSIRCA